MNNDVKKQVSIIGIGGAGLNVIQGINQRDNLYRVVIGEDSDRIRQFSADLVISLKEGADTSDISALNEKDVLKLSSVIKEQSVVIICAGLGGNTGTQMTPVISKLAKQNGAKVITVLFKPFGFEGNSRMQKAIEGENEIKAICDRTIVILNEKLKTFAAGPTFRHAFAVGDAAVEKCVEIVGESINKNIGDEALYSQLDESMNEYGFVESVWK